MSYRPHPTRDGWFYVESRPHGYKGKIERRKVQGLENAIALDAAIKSQRDAPPEELSPKIKEVIPTYLEWAARNLSPRTCDNKAKRMPHIAAYFGEYRVKELSQTIIDKYGAQNKRTVYRVDLAHLMALIKWMQRRKMAPMLSFRVESVPTTAQVKIVPHPDDIMKFIGAIVSENVRMLLKLILFGGLRWSEAAELRWENINLHAGVIRIAERENDVKDLIAIPEPLRPWLEANQKAEGYVFPGRKSGHISRIDTQLRAAAKKSGVPKINPHLLRHASATLLYQATGDIYAVQNHLRHSKVTTSQIYTRFSVEQKKKNTGKLIEHMFNLQTTE